MAVRLLVGDHPPSRVTAYTHELHAELTRSPGRADPRTPGRSRHEPFRVTRRLDALSPLLLEAAASGQMLPEVIIEVDRPDDAAGDRPWFQFVLERVLVVRLVSSWDDEAPLETAVFDYGAVHWRFLGEPADARQWTVHPTAEAS